MTLNGWPRSRSSARSSLPSRRPFGGYMTRVFAGERTLLHPVLRPVERAVYWCCGVEESEEQHWLVLRGLDAVLQRRRVRRRSTRCSGCKGICRSIRRARPRSRRPRLQHVGELRDQHELAVLLARDDHELSRRRWPGSRSIISSRPRPASRWRSRSIRGFVRREAQAIGNFWVDLTRSTLYILLPLSVVLGALLRVAGRAADSERLCRRDDARGREADDRARTGRLAGSDQDSRHQRRRLLQRQLRTPLRESDAAHQFRAARLDLLDRRRPDQHLRPDGQGRAPGLGDLRRHGRSCSSPASRPPIGAEAQATPPSRNSASISAPARRRPAATWKARRSASASPIRPSTPPSRPTRRAARSIPCMTASRRSAASCRIVDISSAR